VKKRREASPAKTRQQTDAEIQKSTCKKVDTFQTPLFLFPGQPLHKDMSQICIYRQERQRQAGI